MRGREPRPQHHRVGGIERSLRCGGTIEGEPKGPGDFERVVPGINISSLPDKTRSIARCGPLSCPGLISSAIGKNGLHLVTSVSGISSESSRRCNQKDESLKSRRPSTLIAKSAAFVGRIALAAAGLTVIRRRWRD